MEPIEATNRAGQSTAVGRPKPVQSADQGPQQRLGFFAVRLRNRLYLGSNAFLFGPNHPANLEKGPGQRDTQAGLPSDPVQLAPYGTIRVRIVVDVDVVSSGVLP